MIGPLCLVLGLSLQSCPQGVTQDLSNGGLSSVTPQEGQESPKVNRLQHWLRAARGAKRRSSSMVRPGLAGSIEKMVAHLVPAFLGLDPSYLHTFLSSYRALASTQQVLDLLFTRYGCVLPHYEENSGPLYQLAVAMSSILDTWLSQYPEDFYQPPTFPCLKMVLAYVQMSMAGSALEHRALLLLAQLEQLEASQKETEGADPEEDGGPLPAQHPEPQAEGAVASPAHLQQPPPTALPEGQEQEQEAPLAPDWQPQ